MIGQWKLMLSFPWFFQLIMRNVFHYSRKDATLIFPDYSLFARRTQIHRLYMELHARFWNHHFCPPCLMSERAAKPKDMDKMLDAVDPGGHSNIVELHIRVNKNAEKGSDFAPLGATTIIGVDFWLFRHKGYQIFWTPISGPFRVLFSEPWILPICLELIAPIK